MDQLLFHEMTLSFLKGTRMYSDGGTIFGPVAKAVWEKKMPVNDANQIASQTNPILIQYQGHNILIDTALNPNKFDEKSTRNQGILGEVSHFEASLTSLGLEPGDIDIILMTHMHNDHANGLTKPTVNGFISAFPNARIMMSAIEWMEVQHPNRRTKGTYQKDNWEAIVNQVETFDEYIEVLPGIEMFHTGGHSRGHSIIRLQQAGETVVHMGDLVLTHAHIHPLYVGGVDDYPMDTIQAKEFWLPQLFKAQTKFIFFHDPYYCMLQFDETGREIVDSLANSGEPLVPWFNDVSP